MGWFLVFRDSATSHQHHNSHGPVAPSIYLLREKTPKKLQGDNMYQPQKKKEKKRKEKEPHSAYSYE